MAKKVAISITVDGDILRSVDNALRAVQSKEITRGKLSSNRSNLIEGTLRDWVPKGGYRTDRGSPAPRPRDRREEPDRP